jgi:hypothetical protein
MINLSCSAAATATSAVVRAAQLLLSDLEHGRRIDAAGTLRAAMETAFGASDASGAWHWKAAYDACEAATVLFLRKYASSMRAKASSPASMLSMLAKVSHLLPTHTRRSEESEALQQFSTPLPLGFVACVAAGVTKTDLVLEPSAGTGLLAILARRCPVVHLPSTSWLRPEPGCLITFSRTPLSPASMRRRSTTISTPISRQVLS